MYYKKYLFMFLLIILCAGGFFADFKIWKQHYSNNNLDLWLQFTQPLGITYEAPMCNSHAHLTCGTIQDIPAEDFSTSISISYKGMDIAPVLIRYLKSYNDNVAMRSARALGYIWPHDAKTLSPPLIKLLNHPNPKVTEQAIWALGRIEPVQPETILALSKIAIKEPIERPDFSDGSHGMGGQITYLWQQPLSEMALDILTDIAPDEAAKIIEINIDSDSVLKQKMAIHGFGKLVGMKKNYNLNGVNNMIKKFENLDLKNFDYKYIINIYLYLINYYFNTNRENNYMFDKILSIMFNACKDSIEYCDYDLFEKISYGMNERGFKIANENYYGVMLMVFDKITSYSNTYNFLNRIENFSDMPVNLVDKFISKIGNLDEASDYIIYKIFKNFPDKREVVIGGILDSLNKSNYSHFKSLAMIVAEFKNYDNNFVEFAYQKILSVIKEFYNDAYIGVRILNIYGPIEFLSYMSNYDKKSEEILIGLLRFRKELTDNYVLSLKSKNLLERESQRKKFEEINFFTNNKLDRVTGLSIGEIYNLRRDVVNGLSRNEVVSERMINEMRDYLSEENGLCTYNYFGSALSVAFSVANIIDKHDKNHNAISFVRACRGKDSYRVE